MRKKLDADTKRNKQIGIKVQTKTREQLEYIAAREGLTLSTVINDILVSYIDTYFKVLKIEWDQIPADEKTRR